MRWHFEPALKRAGLRKIRFHDLRHTYASLLIAQKESPKYIQTQLGHGSIKTTFDTYGHLMEETNPVAAARLSAVVLNGSAKSHQKKKKLVLKRPHKIPLRQDSERHRKGSLAN
jgi:integrase